SVAQRGGRVASAPLDARGLAIAAMDFWTPREVGANARALENAGQPAPLAVRARRPVRAADELDGRFRGSANLAGIRAAGPGVPGPGLALFWPAAAKLQCVEETSFSCHRRRSSGRQRPRRGGGDPAGAQRLAESG